MTWKEAAPIVDGMLEVGTGPPRRRTEAGFRNVTTAHIKVADEDASTVDVRQLVLACDRTNWSAVRHFCGKQSAVNGSVSQ